MQKLLVVYDYGTGGLWAYVIAESAESVRERIRLLEPTNFSIYRVYEKPPAFWNEQNEWRVQTYPSLEALESDWPGLRRM